MLRILFAGCWLLVTGCLNAQPFGGNPPSIRWQQINTDTARIIYPRGMDSTAERVASIVHWLAKNNPAPLGDKLRKINIVLQTQTTIANGYVSLAPFRSEYLLTPTLNNFELGSISWAEELAVHEYRHVEQYNNFRRGLSKLAYYLFGEGGLLVANAAAVPDWFFEGDAVYNETVTTNQGRGRMPSFLNDYKSLWLAGKNYSWMKLRNGSMKDYVPNHYPLGYLLVNYGREKYGLDFWSKVTKDASAFKGLFYPFQKAIKRYAGVDYKTFRKEALDSYHNLPITPGSSSKEKGGSAVIVSPSPNDGGGIRNITSPTKHYVTNYLFPYQLGDDSLLYLRRTYRHRPAFFVRDGSGDHRLRTRDISIDDQFSYRGGKLVYVAWEPDPRWGWKDFSVIKVLDLQSGAQRSISRKTKYFEPDISPDGNKVAAVQILPGGESELHVMDASDGKIIQRFHSAEISLFTAPKFIDDNSLVTAVRLADGRMALATADIASGVVERLTDPSYGVVGYPNIRNGVIYFTGSFSGNDELSGVRLPDKKVFRITETSLGNYFVNAGKKLVWSGFSADGYQLQEMDTSEAKWIEVGEQEIGQPVSAYPIAHSNEFHDILLTDIPTRKFSPSKYKQGGHLFYVHSWRPYYADPDFTYSIYSDNILNTFSSELYYHYNENDKTNGVAVNLFYGALYP